MELASFRDHRARSALQLEPKSCLDKHFNIEIWTANVQMRHQAIAFAKSSILFAFMADTA